MAGIGMLGRGWDREAGIGMLGRAALGRCF